MVRNTFDIIFLMQEIKCGLKSNSELFSGRNKDIYDTSGKCFMWRIDNTQNSNEKLLKIRVKKTSNIDTFIDFF